MAANAKRAIDDPTEAQPTQMARLIGSYESVARMLDQIADTPGLAGIEQFGEHIQPLMKSRNPLAMAAE